MNRHREIFLRQAWALIVREDDDSWMDAQIAATQRQPDAPFAGTGAALEELLAGGANRALLADVVRGMQAELLFGLCYLLEDPGLAEQNDTNIGWRLVEADAFGEPTDVPIACLHGSVLETDPPGREMRPRAVAVGRVQDVTTGKPRITFALERSETGEPGELRIYLNPEGREFLVSELTRLNEQWDHIHLQDETWTVEVPPRTRAYVPDRQEIIDCVKILFRPDEWDRQYFPHVLEGETE